MGSRRWLRLLTPLLALGLVVASCSSDEGTDPLDASDATEGGSPSTETTLPFNHAQFEGEPQPGGSITVGVEYDITTLDPAASLADLSQLTTALAVYDPLVTRDEAGDYAPSLATEWAISDGLSTYTLTLRDDVVFHDGARFDSVAVVDHFERLEDPASQCTCINTVALIESVEAPDPTTVVFTLSRPDAFFLSELTGPIGFIVSPKAIATDGADHPLQPVGTGPFSLESFDPLVLKRNPRYWQRDDEGRALPYLDEIVVQPIEDDGDRMERLRSGDVDLIQTDHPSSIADAADDTRWKVQKITGSSAMTIILNTRVPPFDDVRARRAFAHGVDRRQLNDVMFGGNSRAAEAPIPVGSRYHADVGWPELDLGTAKKLAADLKADGVPVGFTATCVDARPARDVLTTMQQQAKAYGFTIEIELIDSGDYVNRIFGPDHDFVAGCLASTQIADADGLYDLFHSEGSSNLTGYANPTVDEALEDIRNTVDPDEHERLLRIVQEELVRDVPAIPLVYDLVANVYDEGISGLPVPEENVLGAIRLTTLYRRA